MSEEARKLQAAEKLVGKGRVSRREFVQLAIAAGLTAAAGETMFTKAARAEPKKGGTFRMGITQASSSDSLDPATYVPNYIDTLGWGALSNSLTEVDAKGNVVPDIAESMEPSDGAKKWVFKLRRGLTFHNGKTVTPDDVVASIRHHMGENSKSPAKGTLSAVTELKADGDNVVFNLSSGVADFPYYASDYHFCIMPSKDGVVDWQSGIRTGPFKLEKFEPGVSARTVRNDNYHRDVWFDAYELISIPDAAARASALASGDIHYMDRCDLSTLDLFKQTPGIEVTEVTGFSHLTIPMNTTVAPFNDPNVRMALKYAIDRKAIFDKIFLGHGVIGNDNPISPSMPFYADPQPKHEYDPEKARAYLKKAGLDSLKVDLSASDSAFTGCLDAAVLYKESAAKAGIDINVIREPDDSYWTNVWMKKPWSFDYWAGRPTCDWLFSIIYEGGAAWNETFWNNTKFNEMLKAARAESDQKKRAQMYAEMQQLIHDDGGAIVLMFNNYVNANSSKLAHGDIASNFDYDGWRVGSRWWFAS